MQYIKNIFLAAIMVIPVSSCVASSDNCSKEDAMQVESEGVSTLKDWDAVYSSFKRYKKCLDGGSAIGEGYSEAVGTLLANDGSDFQKLYNLTKSDAEFENFVIKHIDELLPREILNKIILNAQLKCPLNAKELCGKIEKAAK